MILAGWPLNSFVMKQSIRIQKDVMGAQNGRMAVLNDLIGAVPSSSSTLLFSCLDARILVYIRSSLSSSSHGRTSGSAAQWMHGRSRSNG